MHGYVGCEHLLLAMLHDAFGPLWSTGLAPQLYGRWNGQMFG